MLRCARKSLSPALLPQRGRRGDYQSAAATLRSSNFWIFPVEVFGNS